MRQTNFFCHFRPFFALLPSLLILSFDTCMCAINEDHMIYGFWNIRSDRHKFLSFWVIFCPFSPLTTQKIKILKLKKTPGDIIILYICTINDNHMMYGFWYKKCDQQFFVILDCFLPFYPSYGPRKSKFKKNEKNTWRYYHFTNVHYKWQSYDVWFLRYGAQWPEFFVILDWFFLLFTSPNNPKNQNFQKMKKTPGDIIILHRCTTNQDHMMYGSWNMEWDWQNFLYFGLFFVLLPH